MNLSPGEIDCSFGASARLKKRSEISRCRESGEKLYCKHYLLLVAPSLSAESRLAVAVTVKIDKRAVARNRIKRIIKEVFRAHKHKLKGPTDMVVVARRDVQACTLEDCKREMLGALNYHGYLKAKD